eukprot:m51a1_g4313 hypothetical protein (240) ;mRNA; f:44007-45155
MSTRTERIFAAFQGPVLSIDSPCGYVVEVGNAWVNRDELPDDLESFCATVRSKCTSSRKHLRTPSLVLTVDIGGATVCSGEFSVFAREPGRYKKKKRKQGQNDAQSGLLVIMNPHQQRSGPRDLVPSSPGPRPDPLPCSFPGMLVEVEVVRRLPNDLPPRALGMVEGVAQALGSALPGFLFQKSLLTNEIMVFVRAFARVEDAERGYAVSQQYASNAIPNVLGMDVRFSVSLLALCRSW